MEIVTSRELHISGTIDGIESEWLCYEITWAIKIIGPIAVKITAINTLPLACRTLNPKVQLMTVFSSPWDVICSRVS